MALENPGLTIAVALAVGLVAQAVARHLRIPGIVLLLGAGALLGADGLGLIDPGILGEGLDILIGFAVAVILFEGGLNLNISRLRSQAVVIRRLISLGALVTTAGGALLAYFAMDWDWRLSLVFGALVMVTGPTVITPLLRRTRIKRELNTILEAEGVFIDAVGAITAVAAFDVAFGASLPHASDSPLGAAMDFAVRFGGGCLLGLLGGAVMTLLVRWERLIPRGLDNVFMLTFVLVLFQISNALLEESGIAAAAVAGVLVGNTRTRVTRELREFKEQLTVMLIGMLFVLLAAEVRLDEVRALGTPGLMVVLGLMFLVRPISVLVCTMGSGLSAADKAFLAWLAPRGIVAAAVSSLFAQEMIRNDINGGTDLRALVFLVIAVTVLLQGLLASPVARLLGVRRPNQGYAILGANALGLELGKVLREGGHEVVFIDNNASATGHAEEAGFRALWGSGVDDRLLQRAELDARLAAVGTTTNEELNGIFALNAISSFRVPLAYTAMQKGNISLKMEKLLEAGAMILYGGPVDLDRWVLRVRRGRATTQCWKLGEDAETNGRLEVPDDLSTALLPMAHRGRRKAVPFDASVKVKAGSRMWFAVSDERAEGAYAWLGEAGWTPADDER